MKHFLLLPLLALLHGCISLPAPRTIACEYSRRAPIRASEDGKTASIELDVVTYNVEGLPKRIRRGRHAALNQIGTHLAALRRAGTAPDVVMFQEVFSRSSRNAVLLSGYPSIASGPSARAPVPRSADRSLPGRRNPRQGELGLRLVSSGLVIASEYPILIQAAQPFARGSCAGRDCLANKGVLFARIAIPGLPSTVDIFTTHLNSMGASRVPERRHLAAHGKQVRELVSFLHARADFSTPTIFGGDFNMRSSAERFAEFERWKPLRLVHRYCTEQRDNCKVRPDWDEEEPWMATQDLQLFRPGEVVEARPVRVEPMFDGSEGGPRLSDHEAFRVVYELSWPARLTPAAVCASARSLS